MSAPHAFTLRQLQYLVAVAETLSFRKAAEHCHVAQPSLSAQLAELESALGVRMFERDRRHVLLTSAGRDLVEQARRILAEADALRDAAKRVGDPLSASIRIGVIPTISPYLLPKIAPVLRRDFPRMKIHWVEEKTPVLIAALGHGALDAVLLALEAEIGKVEQSIIATDPFVLATPRNHSLGLKKSGASAEELHNVGVLLLDEGHCFREQALAYCSKSKAQELEFRATSLSTLAQMVASGAGVTLLPELSVATEGKRADLKIRKFSTPSPHRTIGLVWRKGSSLAEALQKVADSIRRAYPR
jgi:LysR family transcriptional regulator, hydrogen peroxide-inducible genes activator